MRRRLRARAPAAAVGLDADPEGDAPHLLARALPARSSSELRAAIPDLALTTDIIVGFPGETEDDFRETLEVVEEVGFDGAFTFVYSPRAGTEAAAWPSRCRTRSSASGSSGSSSVVQRIAAERNEERVGRVEEVLVEGRAAPTTRSCAAARAGTRP